MFYPVVFAFSCFFGFLVTLGIGANDLANSFGTVYGSKVLGLKQLVVIATICELSGAMLMGGEVAKTIKKGIASEQPFHDEPQQFMYGMMCALIATALWLALATWKNLPVSTTHSIIGGVIGFALVYGGFKDGVKWATKKDDFPFVGGVTPVFVSWVVSPALAMAIAAFIYFILRCFVLRHRLDMKAVFFFGAISYLTMFGNIYFIITKGFKNRVKMTKTRALWISALVALPFGIVGMLVVGWLVNKEKQRLLDEEASKTEPVEMEQAEGTAVPESTNEPIDEPIEGATAVVEVEADAKRKDNGFELEMYDPAVENVFRYLQIATAFVVSFAHGANDVSNGVGAVAAVYHLSVNDGKFPDKKGAAVPLWLLAAGGIGISIGLAIWGRRILKVLGEDLVKLTASRGFCSQFAAGLTVSFASVLGLPVSTTHCITGAVLGVGVVDDIRNGVDWMLVLKVAVGWVVTVIFTAGTSALVYTPFFFKG